jgi:hypothetical protein
MRIKINDKIYRLKEIESGDDSLMELVEEPKYKDGDFVVNEAGSILIFRKKDEDRIYDHALFNNVTGLSITQLIPSSSSIRRHATEEEKQKMLDALAERGKRWNAEKKCIEDIPKRKFKKGDKVRIKHGVSSKTHHSISPYFPPEMDCLIGKTMTVDRYTIRDNYVVCNGSGWCFHEDWLEPYEELKEGDLAIFWDSNKESAFIGIYKQFLMGVIFQHKDHRGYMWKNAIKFESKEQFEKLIKGEI